MKATRFVPVLIMAVVMGLSACANTVRGVGRDVNQTADAVKDAVD